MPISLSAASRVSAAGWVGPLRSDRRLTVVQIPFCAVMAWLSQSRADSSVGSPKSLVSFADRLHGSADVLGRSVEHVAKLCNSFLSALPAALPASAESCHECAGYPDGPRGAHGDDGDRISNQRTIRLAPAVRTECKRSPHHSTPVDQR